MSFIVQLNSQEPVVALVCVVVGWLRAIPGAQVIEEEGLTEKSERLGRILRKELDKLKGPLVTEVRGKGLLNAIVIRPQEDGKSESTILR